MENLLEELEKTEGEKTAAPNFEFTDGGGEPESNPDNDFFSQFSNDSAGGFFDNEEENEEAPKSEERAREDFYKAAARQYVVTFNAIVPKVASLYSKANAEGYKLTDDEQKEYEQVTEAFFASIQWHPDPKAMFIGFSSMLMVVIYLRAAEDKKRIEAEKKRAEAMKNWRTAETTEERAKHAHTMKEAENDSRQRRMRFEIDKDGFFERDVNGAYIKKTDRIEKPTEQVKNLIRKFEFFSDGQPRSGGQINTEIRAELYGE